jgi:hypothetical protein
MNRNTDIEYDVFTTAIEGGVQYWAQVAEYRPSVGHEGWYATLVSVTDLPWEEYVDLDEATDSTGHRVDRETIQRGMKELAGETAEYREEHRIHPRSEHARLSYALSTVVASGFTMFADFEDMLDASTADMIVQAAIFGEVIYG